MALELKDFSFVTVMDVEVLNKDGEPFTPAITLDSLTISNITQEGPEKETRGGIHSEPIVRFRKTVRLEMEDVVARAEAFEHLFGANIYKDTDEKVVGFGITDKFATMIQLKGKTFVIDRDSGERQWIKIAFKRFLPDSVFDMTMEAEGDIGMINVAGELFPDECGEYFTVDTIPGPECPAPSPEPTSTP